MFLKGPHLPQMGQKPFMWFLIALNVYTSLGHVRWFIWCILSSLFGFLLVQSVLWGLDVMYNVFGQTATPCNLDFARKIHVCLLAGILLFQCIVYRYYVHFFLLSDVNMIPCLFYYIYPGHCWRCHCT